MLVELVPPSFVLHRHYECVPHSICWLISTILTIKALCKFLYFQCFYQTFQLGGQRTGGVLGSPEKEVIHLAISTKGCNRQLLQFLLSDLKSGFVLTYK